MPRAAIAHAKRELGDFMRACAAGKQAHAGALGDTLERIMVLAPSAHFHSIVQPELKRTLMACSVLGQQGCLVECVLVSILYYACCDVDVRDVALGLRKEAAIWHAHFGGRVYRVLLVLYACDPRRTWALPVPSGGDVPRGTASAHGALFHYNRQLPEQRALQPICV